MRTVKTTLACLLSAGWLLPAWFAQSEWHTYKRSTILVDGRWRSMDSFPHAQASQDALAIAAIWLAAAICFWVWFALARSRRP
jgi:hypothetical protein